MQRGIKISTNCSAWEQSLKPITQLMFAPSLPLTTTTTTLVAPTHSELWKSSHTVPLLSPEGCGLVRSDLASTKEFSRGNRLWTAGDPGSGRPTKCVMKWGMTGSCPVSCLSYLLLQHHWPPLNPALMWQTVQGPNTPNHGQSRQSPAHCWVRSQTTMMLAQWQD